MPTYAAPGVYVEEIPSSAKSLTAGPTAVAAFVGFTETFPTDDPNDPAGLAPRLVTSWTQFEALYGSFAPGCMLPIAVNGYFANGGSLAYICRVPHTAASTGPASAELEAADRKLGRPLRVETRPIAAGTELARLDGDASEATHPDGVTVVVAAEDAGDDADGRATFSLSVVVAGTEVERHDGLGLAGTNVATKINETSEWITVALDVPVDADLDQQLVLLKPGQYELVKEPPATVKVNGRAFAGSETARRGINGLSIAEDVTMVVVPDLITAATQDDGTVDLGMWKAVQTSLISHCEQSGNRMAILDAPPGMTVQQVKEWRTDDAMYDSAFAAFYYPWIKVENPGAVGPAEILVPPSGHIAGVWARTDETRGVWKAPANETIRGLLDLERSVTQTEQGLLNPIGINCIRPFGSRGVRVWGARTLSSDTDWQYINVRRLFNMIETTILQGTQYAVFEPNDVALWEGVKRTVGSFLRGLWSVGALAGLSADEAFFVKCDADTNPPEAVDAGLLVVEVGIAPSKPAEFVVFRVSQKKQSVG